MLHAAFLRSNLAHARIRTVDVSAARRREGVVAVYTASDLGNYWAPGPTIVPLPPIPNIIANQRTQVPLAKDKVRHVGEPLAVVVAKTRYLAEDALADIIVELDPLPAVVDLEKAHGDLAVRVHDDLQSNVAAHVHQSRGDYAAARARADHIISRRFHYDHGASSPIETRGLVANFCHCVSSATSACAWRSFASAGSRVPRLCLTSRRPIVARSASGTRLRNQ